MLLEVILKTKTFAARGKTGVELAWLHANNDVFDDIIGTALASGVVGDESDGASARGALLLFLPILFFGKLRQRSNHWGTETKSSVLEFLLCKESQKFFVYEEFFFFGVLSGRA